MIRVFCKVCVSMGSCGLFFLSKYIFFIHFSRPKRCKVYPQLNYNFSFIGMYGRQQPGELLVMNACLSMNAQFMGHFVVTYKPFQGCVTSGRMSSGHIVAQWLTSGLRSSFEGLLRIYDHCTHSPKISQKKSKYCSAPVFTGTAFHVDSQCIQQTHCLLFTNRYGSLIYKTKTQP